VKVIAFLAAFLLPACIPIQQRARVQLQQKIRRAQEMVNDANGACSPALEVCVKQKLNPCTQLEKCMALAVDGLAHLKSAHQSMREAALSIAAQDSVAAGIKIAEASAKMKKAQRSIDRARRTR